MEPESREIVTSPEPEKIAKGAAQEKVREFLELEIGGKIIRCPYWMNLDPKFKGTPLYTYFPWGGKRNPKQLETFAEEKARELKFDFGSASEEEISNFMIRFGIGIDCSGLAYQVCETVYSALGGQNFISEIIGREQEDRGIRKTSARDLTDLKNSLKIGGMFSVKPGDLIRCFGGAHLIVIISREDDEILCVHATNNIETPGVHQFSIKIKNPTQTIFEQDWTEKGDDGRPFNEWLKEKLQERDGIWRLQIIDGLYKSPEGK